MTAIALLLPSRDRLPGALPRPAARALGRADREQLDAGGRAQLRRHFRLTPDRLPVAALTRRADAGSDAGNSLWLRADPAHVAPDLNGVRLLGWGEGLGMDVLDAQALLPILRPLVGDAGYELDAPHPARWSLRSPAGTPLPDFVPPEDAVGDDLFNAIPQGDDAVSRRWRALITEVQVALHQHPWNRARADHGRPAVNSLWFWGAGVAPDSVQSSYMNVRSPDPLLQALAGEAGAATTTPAADTARGAIGDSLVDLRHLRSLDVLGTQVLPPLLASMERDEFDTLLLDFEDGTRLRLRRGQRWRFWRKSLRSLDA
ncbi:phosphoglycerate mutase [Pseudoxanthomonas suwonensis]|uniref:phosphoglycerate mutase n=1 Tax=Pseudoxanthomonas suwonensis TaxID=314722 RepID=UPI00138F7A77|nr:phosphoglycerate mutase [Pseudoxanthomonas suwonensis]KAF1700675.1 phosphoglycerate mutase [Pseudoxanthomonas suwonensis]